MDFYNITLTCPGLQLTLAEYSDEFVQNCSCGQIPVQFARVEVGLVYRVELQECCYAPIV